MQSMPLLELQAMHSDLIARLKRQAETIKKRR
jgi:hypothetical protein